MRRAAIRAIVACGVLTVVAIVGYLAVHSAPLAVQNSSAQPVSDRADRERGPGAATAPGFTSGESQPSETVSDEARSLRDEDALAARPAMGDLGVVVGSGQTNWCDVFQSPDTASDRLAQALVGDAARVRQHLGAWSEAESENGEAWSGWISAACVARGEARFRREMSGGPWFVVVTAPVLHTTLGDIPFGAVLPDVSEAGKARLRLPDGRVVAVDANSVRARGEVKLEEALTRVRQFLRAPYQRGANTVEAMDAAGLVQLVFRVVGRTLPRTVNALQRAGQDVPRGDMRAGDVVFFGTFDETHPHAVILLDAGKTFLEASPASGVNLGLMEQMRNRSIVAVRRYVSPPES